MVLGYIVHLGFFGCFGAGDGLRPSLVYCAPSGLGGSFFYKNLTHILRRSERERPPNWLKAFCLVSISRGERMTRILETDGQKPANYRFLQPYEEPKWP